MEESACPLKDIGGGKPYSLASLETRDLGISRRKIKSQRKYYSFFGHSGGATGETNTMRRGKGFKAYDKHPKISTSNRKKRIKHLMVYTSGQQNDIRIKRLQEEREREDEREAVESKMCDVWVVCHRLDVTSKKKCLKVDTESIPGLMFLSWNKN